MYGRDVRFVVLLALSGCSIVTMHDGPTFQQTRCSLGPPIADTALGAVALGAGTYHYATETRTSPFPISMVVAAAWATASAVYGYSKAADCVE